MIKIPLQNGAYALVDDADYDKVRAYRWHYYDSGKRRYVVSGNTILHRFILDAPSDMFVDHVNGDGLDNRRCNIRLCTPKENTRNRSVHENGTSGYKGVSWHKVRSAWSAQIGVDYRLVHLGLYESPEDAAIVYNHAAIKYHGDFARLNDIPDWSTMHPVKRGANKTSQYKGVSWHKMRGRWQSKIYKDGTHYFLGLFDTEEEARDAYTEMRSVLRGEK